MRSARYLIGLVPGLVPILAGLLVLAACGPAEEPTPTPAPTPAPGEPTPTPVEPTPAPAFDAEGYFSGGTIQLITGTSPGGGFDTMARLYALFLPNHIPGNPRVVVQNVPGGGQLLGHQRAYEAEPDGLTAGLMHPRWITNQVLGQEIERWDFTQVIALGTPTALSESNLFCIDSSVATSWEEALNAGRTIQSGGVEPGQASVDILEYAGLPFRNIYGYGGSAEVLAAFDRGELDMPGGWCTPLYVERLYPEWAEQNRVVPLFWNMQPKPDDDWIRTLGVEPDQLPYVLDLPGLELSESERRGYQVYEAINMMSRLFFLPPGTPDEVVETWEAAIASMVEDPEFQVRMEDTGFDFQYGFGREEYEEFVRSTEGFDEETIEMLSQLMQVD